MQSCQWRVEVFFARMSLPRIFCSEGKPCFQAHLFLALANQMYSFPCRAIEVSSFNLLHILLCQWRFQHSSSYGHTAYESELPTGPLLPADLLKDLNKHEKTLTMQFFLYVTVIQPPPGWLPGCLAVRHQGASDLKMHLQTSQSKKSYYLWQTAEPFDSFVQNLLWILQGLL